ncbi:MAG: tyrosine-type recombinase/integrase [Clostridia bacterium]
MRSFGTVRRLPSGRWQAFYVTGTVRTVAPRTFRTKTEAGDWLAAERARASTAPVASITVAEATERWIRSRSLAPRTEELYRWLVGHYFGPIGSVDVRKLTPDQVSAWLPPGSSGAKAYRLLSAVMRSLVATGALERSPCILRGAGTEHAPERPVVTVAEALALADAMAPWGAAVDLAVWCHLRRGEVLGLMWEDIEGDTLHVRRARVAMMDRSERVVVPKTAAGRRTVTIPAPILARIGSGTGQVVPLTVPQFNRAWAKARRKTGIAVHFHDLRHSGLTWVAAQGATVAELMVRAGHASPAAALRYQHATRERDRVLAAALGQLLDPRMHEGCTPAEDIGADQGQ